MHQTNNAKPVAVQMFTCAGQRPTRELGRLLTDAGVEVAGLTPVADALAHDGKTAMFIAVDGHPAGVLAVADTIKPDASSTRRGGKVRA